MSKGVMHIKPMTLEGRTVRLEPIHREHWKPLWEVAKDSVDDIFRWIPYPMRTTQDFERWADKALLEQQRGESLVFVTVERKTGQAIGSTRFMNIDREPASGDRINLDRTRMAKNGRKHGSQILDAAPCFRRMGLHPRRTEDRCLESEIAHRNRADRSEGRRNSTTTLDYVDGTSTRHRLLQHS